MRTADIAPAESLSGGRSGAAGERSSVLGKALIVAQVSLSFVLLISAGLFVRSLIKLTSVETGFQRQNVLWFSVGSFVTGLTNETQLAHFYRRVEERTSAIPGVQAVSFSVFAFNQGGWSAPAWAEGDSAAPPAERTAWYDAVGPGYFSTMGSPILDGRPIGAQDTATSPRVAVINETMARRFFRGGSPVGKRFGMGEAAHSKDIEVIGVVRDSKYYQLDEGPRAVAYFPYTKYIPDWGIGLYLSNFPGPLCGQSGTHRAIGSKRHRRSELERADSKRADSCRARGRFGCVAAAGRGTFGLLWDSRRISGLYRNLRTYVVRGRKAHP